MKNMVNDLLTMEGVRGVHDLDTWSINENLRVLSAHVKTEDTPICVGATIQRGVNEILFHKYHIQHATLQLECEGCDPSMLYCDITEVNHFH